jgi:imidazolonepropionase-like amidohydrolase
MRGLICGAICAVVGFVAAPLQAAPPGVESLAKAPADAQRFTILSKSGPHGHAETWRKADGTLVSRGSMNLRGLQYEIEQTTRLGKDGMPDRITLRGFTPQGDAGETFVVANGQATWKSPFDSGSAHYSKPAMYVVGGVTFESALLIEALLKTPSHELALLPGGKASVERLGSLQVGQGTTRKTIVCWGISGLGNSPQAIWTNQDGTFFGTAGQIGELPVGYEGELDAMTTAQDEALAAKSPALAHSLPKTPAGPVAFAHVRAFVGDHYADDQTVVVDKGVITAVGPAASTTVPSGALVIEGKNQTLVPGLWDSHMHVGNDFSGPFLLSLGITSARDPGNNDSLTLARAQRRMAGDLLMPHVYPSSMIDGKGPLTAQVANVATSQQQAIDLVRRAKAEGLVGVKFYGTFDKSWVRAAAAEAHTLGLHVHGHLPVGMRPHEAIAEGYDEITHIYFVIMEAMPDSVVNVSNTIQRLAGPGKYGMNVDLNADPMKSLIALMAKQRIVSDPTLVVAEATLYAENGAVSAAYQPYVGTLPPATERGFKLGGLEPPPPLTRADYRKSFAKLVELVGVMHRAGVPIVAGTDGSGLELVRELELYVQAGFTPAEALQAATIVPARNVGVDRTTGSIAVGKAADLVLVEGDPSRRIGDLRNTRVVMMDGKLIDADGLRAASGFSGRPHPAN